VEFLLPLHIMLMSIAAMLVVYALMIARRRKKNWLKIHRAFALSGVFTSFLGFASIASQKMLHHFHHFSSAHAKAGFITLCLLSVTPLLGLLIAKLPKWIRPLHRALGRTTFVALMVTAVMGVFRFLRISER
jgi:uncharacterized membrane protein YozB (DUF420 family)